MSATSYSSRRLRYLSCIGVLTSSLILTSLFAQTPQVHAEGTTHYSIALSVQDDKTHFGISHALISSETVKGSVPANLSSVGSTNNSGRLDTTWIAGTYAVEVSAPGYKAARTVLHLGLGNTLKHFVFSMEPVNQPVDMQGLASQTRDHYSLITGYVKDADSNEPLPGVAITLNPSGFDTQTNVNGFFAVSVPISGLANDDDPPTDVETITLAHAGYNTYSLSNVTLLSKQYSLLHLSMTPGRGKETHEDPLPLGETGTPPEHQMNVDEVPPDPPMLRDWRDDRQTAKPQSIMRTSVVSSSATSFQTNAITLPAQIRVGSDCSTILSSPGHKQITCATVTAYPLETYVAEGLQYEWPAYFPAQSLAAGAVAYRSYGVYRTNHPLNAAFDICNTASCQVFNDDDNQMTSAAAQLTSGVLIARSGKVVEAEYAAETNGLANPNSGCPDGFSGEPAHQWPCMPDALSAGATFGYRGESDHGRGMSQRGSMRWASGKNPQKVKVTSTTPWECIVDHYYNDNGNSTDSGTGNRTGFLVNEHGDGTLASGASTLSDLDGSNQRTLTTTYPFDTGQSFSAGQQFILSGGLGDQKLYKIRTDGSGSSAVPIPKSYKPYDDESIFSWTPVGDTLDDGTASIAFTSDDDIIVLSEAGSEATNITNNGSAGADQMPSWSPDGKMIATAELRFGNFEHFGWYIAIMNADGSNQIPVTPTDGSMGCFFPRWSPDMKTLLASCSDESGPGNVYSITLQGMAATAMTRLTDFGSSRSATTPSFTQDGQNIIFYTESQNASKSPTTYMMDKAGKNLHSIDTVSGGAVSVTSCRRFDVY